MTGIANCRNNLVEQDWWPGSEKMKQKCDMEVKKSKSKMPFELNLSTRLSNGQDTENDAGFFF